MSLQWDLFNYNSRLMVQILSSICNLDYSYQFQLLFDDIDKTVVFSVIVLSFFDGGESSFVWPGLMIIGVILQ